jgi:hypothetical protein
VKKRILTTATAFATTVLAVYALAAPFHASNLLGGG